jgi:GNAT superfamily N-acetyltransferase
MPYTVAPIELSDFAIMAQFTPENGGDLTSASIVDAWPTEHLDADTIRKRYLWSLHRQQQAFFSKPLVHFMKAVDEASGEIVATAVWHIFPNGPPAPPTGVPSAQENEAIRRARGGYPDGFPLALWEHCIGKVNADRRGWMGSDRSWALTQLQTRPDWQRRGAGRALVQWGLDYAHKEGCPVFVEGATAAVEFYEKMGFKGVGSSHRVDRGAFGGEGEIVWARMRADP